MTQVQREPLNFEVNGRKYREVFSNGRDHLVVTNISDDGMLGQALRLQDGRLLPAVSVRIVKDAGPYELGTVAELGKEESVEYYLKNEIEKLIREGDIFAGTANGIRFLGENGFKAFNRRTERREAVRDIIYKLCMYEIPETILVPVHMMSIHQGLSLPV